MLLLFSYPVGSNSLRPHRLQPARPLCPLPSPEVCPSSCPLSRWCHPAISSSDALFSFSSLSFPAPGTFPMSQLVSASASVLPTSIQGWLPLRLAGLISLLSGTLRRPPAPQFKGINSQCSNFFMVQQSQLYVTTGKTIALTIWIFFGTVMFLLFNTLSRFGIAFLPRSKLTS